jgi:RNA polymerase sigma-70 factor (ECF subfamily)
LGRERRLQECVDKLDEADRSLLERRYAEKGSIRQFARQLGVDAAQLYKRLGRIRQVLLDCIGQTAADEGSERQ